MLTCKELSHHISYSELLGYIILVNLSVTLYREVFHFFRKNIPQVLDIYATGLTNLTRRKEFLAERLVVVGSRNLSAFVVDVRIHPINTEVGLLLGERLERETKKARVNALREELFSNLAL